MSVNDMVVTGKGLRFRGALFPCSIGRAGTTGMKAEGDGATPTGTHQIIGCLFRADRVARPCDFARPIGPQDGWSDAPDDPAYNQLVRQPHSYSHENLRRADPMYDIILTTNWNAKPPEPGKGSAIFMHIWRRPGYPTAGCVAISKPDLIKVCQHISIGTKLIVPELR